MDASKDAVYVHRRGEEVAVRDGRPNGELLLATGALEDDNPADCLVVQVCRPVHEYLSYVL